MATTTPIWPALVAAIRDLKPAVRMKWSGDDDLPPWEPWIIVSSVSYLETGRVGPVPFNEVEWVELDPSRRNERGRLINSDQKDEVYSALKTASVAFEVTDGVFRITADAG
jgi:hypothetical protein